MAPQIKNKLRAYLRYKYFAGFSIFIFVILIAVCYGIFNFGHLTYASTNIDAANHWAWNDVIGWIDFLNPGAVSQPYVYGTRLEGYASSSVGYIALNCNSTPNGNICGGPAGTWNVINNTGGNAGVLSGWAWNDAIGWISFSSANTSSTYSYNVSINPADGSFSGWAWNDNIGWLSFNCSNPGVCGSSNYKVQTAWTTAPVTGYLYSSIFDTQVTGGASINSIIWRGQLNGGAVSFQIASSNCSNGATDPPACVTNVGSWNYLGPDGSTSTYYGINSNSGDTIPVNLKFSNNQRYVRYNVRIQSDASQSQTPVVSNVIINWGP